MGGIFIIGIIFMIISFAVSQRLKNKFKKYSKIQLNNGMTGREIAERMLADNGIYDVTVTHVQGQLTDHYNPGNRTVNLSDDVYYGNSAAAAAVAAHECGHAVQHANAYSFLQFRSAMVPLQNISGQILNVVVLLSIFGGGFLGSFGWQSIVGIIIACYSIITLFSFVTLPVEFDASKRALQWIQRNNIATSKEYDMSKDALKWAAMTYVVAALGSLVTLLYFVMSFLGADE